MDRLRFVPGAPAREEIEKANGLIYFHKETAMGFADEFLKESGSILYQSALACLSDGDRVNITFQGTTTHAILTEASGRTKELYKIEDNAQGLTKEQSELCVSILRNTLGGNPNFPEPESQNFSSVALSVQNLLELSGGTWYFVVLPSSSSSASHVRLSRPMRAFDALILSALLTLVLNKVPLVFGLIQKKPGAPPAVWKAAKDTQNIDTNSNVDFWLLG